jgi:predicted Ser/Thr protein kinase
MQAPAFRPPVEGDMVGAYRVEEKLGDGGFGFVYKVERAGRPYALKVIRARELEGWGQREISILRRVRHPNVVRFRACDRWPDPDTGSLCFVMDLVVGRTLERYVLEENPSARWGARLLLEVGLALARILEQGVLHRDLKRENILIRDADGRPVLVDFGVGWLAGEPTITGERTPPGTDEYRSPEYVRFAWDEARRKEGYRPGVGDELWALGVTLYWLLTDVLPFGSRTQGGLYGRILEHRPPAPHECNPRVPPALGALCMRMLEKQPEARFATYAELCGALETVLAGAEGDARWDVPLMDPDAPDALPTEPVPGMGPPEEELAALAWKAARPRRGCKAARKRPPEKPRDEALALPAPAPKKQAGAPANPAEALAALLAEVAPGRAWEAVPPPVPESAPPAPPPPVPAVARPAAKVLPPAPVPEARGPLRRVLSRVLPTTVGLLPVRALAVEAVRPAVLLGVLAALALTSAGAFLFGGREAPVPVPTTPGVFLPEGWLPECPIPRACPVSELAASPETAEAGRGAAPLVASSPAPATAMAHQQDSRLSPQEKPAPAPQRTQGRCVPSRQRLCVAGVCSWVLVACPAAQVRGSPGAEDCPPGAVETMAALGISIGDSGEIDFLRGYNTQRTTVMPSTSGTVFEGLGQLDYGTVLTGQLYFGETRVSGRFTRAQQGVNTYPVCLEMSAEREDVGGASDSGVIWSLQRIRAVDRFD